MQINQQNYRNNDEINVTNSKQNESNYKQCTEWNKSTENKHACLDFKLQFNA